MARNELSVRGPINENLQAVGDEDNVDSALLLSTKQVEVKGRFVVDLKENGGGALVVGNDPKDNKVYLEAFSGDRTTSASEFLLTGRFNTSINQITLKANTFLVQAGREVLLRADSSGVTILGDLTVNGKIKYPNAPTVTGADKTLQLDTSGVDKGVIGID